MLSADMSKKLHELDRLVNDPSVLLDAARVWDLLDQLSAEDLAAVDAMSAARSH